MPLPLPPSWRRTCSSRRCRSTASAPCGRCTRRASVRQRLARHHAHVDDAFDGWSLGWLSPDFAAWSIERECAAITCPLLLVQGTRDEYGSLVHVERIAALAQGPVESMVLEGVGHTPHREREVEVIEGLVRLAGQPAGQPT